VNRINGVDARTWLLVPGDRPDQFSAHENREAYALVLDLAGEGRITRSVGHPNEVVPA
jgi:hypothetical protein